MLSVIIPTRNKATRLVLTLRKLAAAAADVTFSMEVTVVNDWSTDSTREVVQAASAEFKCPLTLVDTGACIGRAAARNRGTLMALGSVYLFLDDDIIVTGTDLREHYLFHAGTKRALARSPLLHTPFLRNISRVGEISPDLPPQLKHRHEAFIAAAARGESLLGFGRRTSFEAAVQKTLVRRAERPHLAAWVAATGGCLSVEREVFRQLGGFDEQFGPSWGIEDLEFGYRAAQCGIQITQLDRATVLHLDHATGNGQRTQDHWRNIEIFSRKHGADLGCELGAFVAAHLS